MVIAQPKIITHPFREGIQGILEDHFDPSITKNFVLSFEAEHFSKESENIWRQLKDGQYIMEVRYRNPDNTIEYICDVYSWETKSRTIVHLLRHITDAYKLGKIGRNWVASGGKISEEITSGEYETPVQPDEIVPFTNIYKKEEESETPSK